MPALILKRLSPVRTGITDSFNASDYPLPAVVPLFSLRKMAKDHYITETQAKVLGKIRNYNALMFDLVLKRCLRVKGSRLQDIVFASRRVFHQTQSGQEPEA